jgi:hypothetical protein
MHHPIRAIGAWAVVLLTVLVAVPALLPDAAAARDASAGPGIDPALLADASWHGRPIQRPVPRATSVTDRSPGLTRGTGYRTPAGSERVRDLQRRLLRLGYRPGTRDGRYGPRTQAAVVAFQRKHGLEQDGSAGSETLALLRRRTTPGAPAEDPALSVASRAPGATPAAPPLAPAAGSDDDGPAVAAIVLAAGAFTLLALGMLRTGRRRRAPATDDEQQPAETEVEPVTEPLVVDEEPRIRRTAPIHHHGPPWERRAALRERILGMRADGMTLQEIADRLTAEGVPTLGGVRRWQPWSVRAATRATTPAHRPAPTGRRRT